MRLLCFLIWLITPLSVLAQTVTCRGVVKNGRGELLPLANIQFLPDNTITSTDGDGRFLVNTQKGPKRIIVSYTGFETLNSKILLQSDTVLNFVMFNNASQLKEVTIIANRYSSEDILQSTRTGTTTLTQKDIYGIPVLGGEADVIKTLQLLPGTLHGVEGSSDLFVRGGAADQNLVLLDGATIYNTSHLFGFLSVFNPSVLDNVEAIIGGFPAQYGGRLSSILDISSNANLADKTRVFGDIGLIASRLYIEQPLVKNKASLWIAGRRTYIDQVVKTIGEELPYYFYDINGKLILHPSTRDKLEFSYFGGNDILNIFRDRNNDGKGFLTSYASRNSSQTFRWDHSLSSEWRNSVVLARSAFQYNISNVFGENELIALSDIEDYSGKIIFRKDSVGKNRSLQFGAEWIRHAISPNIINTAGTITELLESSASKGKIAQELAVHIQEEFPLDPKLLMQAGLRLSAGLVKGKRYFVPEPRLAIRYAFSGLESFKLSYSHMAQYLHRISNSAVSTPADVWYSVTDKIHPQTSHQIAAAWQRFSSSKKVFLSVETYYKTMHNLIGYEEGTNLLFNTDFESKLVQGAGRAYGLELLIRKESGKFTGWISYTLSWSLRHFKEINGGNWFPSRYDRRHNGAIVMQYTLGKRWAASLVWEYISGARFTPIIGQYAVLAPTLTGVDLIPLYSGLNQVRLSDTHRLDAGLKFMSKPGSKFQWQWFAGVYNLYNRASPVGIIIKKNVDGSLQYLQPGLFGLLPFISYGFKF